jgi:hypothetical protein
MDVLTKRLVTVSVFLFLLGWYLFHYWYFQYHLHQCEDFVTKDPVSSLILGPVKDITYRGILQDNYRYFSGTRVEEGEFLFLIKASKYSGQIQVSWVSSAAHHFTVVRLDGFTGENKRVLLWLR